VQLQIDNWLQLVSLTYIGPWCC